MIGFNPSSIISSTAASLMTQLRGANCNDASPLMSTRRVSSTGAPTGKKFCSAVSIGLKLIKSYKKYITEFVADIKVGQRCITASG